MVKALTALGARLRLDGPAVRLIAFGTVLYLVPFYFPRLWIVCWLALWPAIEIAHRSDPKRAAIHGYFLGLAIFVLGVYWLAHVSVLGWLVLSAYLAAYVAAFCLIVSWAGRRRRVPLIVLAPTAWVALELVRAKLFSGFPWLQLGHSQHAFLPIIQIADLAGVYGVSFLLAMGGATLAALRTARGGRSMIQGGVTVAAFVAALAYGFWRVETVATKEGPRIATVQGNIPQSVKLNYTVEQSKASLDKHVKLSWDAMSQKPDLIVWAETMSPGYLNLPGAGYGEWSLLAELSRYELRKLATGSKCHLLIGSIAVQGNPPEDFYNSAFFYAPDMSLLDRYDKVHIVPFGEFVPFGKQFPFLRRIVPVPTDLTPGDDLVVFDGPRGKFGVLICYEDVVPDLARQLRKDGADFAVNMTNDGWFKGSPELEQHNGIAVFRAVENRMGIVRATNTGMSSFISPVGRVHAVLEQNGDRREIEGKLVANVQVSDSRTLYTRIGDTFAWLCAAATLVALLWTFLKPRGAGRGREPCRQPPSPTTTEGV